MKIIEPNATIIDPIDGDAIMRKIERAARTCYQSFSKAGEGTAQRLISNCIQRGHESILEHVSVSAQFVTDRAIHNEIVRHRLTSASCESTRYCKYEDGVVFIKPIFRDDSFGHLAFYWNAAMRQAEESYCQMIAHGAVPQEARSVLPLSLKCEYIITCDLREWRHIFQLRCAHAAHPEMRRVMIPLLDEFKAKIPVIFDDINVEEEKNE